MPTLEEALDSIANARKRDPLAPVTVVAPSHLAALQLRRRLAERGPFAGVRFEPLPRLAELLGAPSLALQDRRPLARPIGDYITTTVAREALGGLAAARDLPGFARVLRQTFQRLRRGGFRDAGIPADLESGNLAEVVRLYGLFRESTAAFYDPEDLLDAASLALDQGTTALGAELGSVYFVSPAPMTAGGDHLLRSLRRAARSFTLVDDPSSATSQKFVLAPDPASEAREVAREVLSALEAGYGLDEIAVFHGAERSYGRLLSEACVAAGIPAALMPGRPLVETPAGRAVLALAELPLSDYARAATLDFLGMAPLRRDLPAGTARAGVLSTAWQRLTREAGVTHGASRWQAGLTTLIQERREALTAPNELSDNRRALYEADIGRAGDLQSVIRALIEGLESLRPEAAAASFITRFKAVVAEYLRDDAEGMDGVISEIDQLGTIDAVAGRFSLASFAEALRANLTIAHVRERSLGDGVLIADYTLAAGLRFKRVILAGAYEGTFPAGPGAETLVTDDAWARLRAKTPFVEDAALRLERNHAAALRAMNAASESVLWSAPLRASDGSRELYPSDLMLAARRALNPQIATATALRTARRQADLRRPASPLAARLDGPVFDLPELQLRRAVLYRQQGIVLPPEHALSGPGRLLTARRGAGFSAYDGNIAALEGKEALLPGTSFSPTGLETYATCGFRYFLGSVLRLRPVKEPEENDTIDAAERGTLIHAALQAFFQEQAGRGRPGVGKAWMASDADRLLVILDELLAEARARGATGLDVYAELDREAVRGDLVAFLEEDSAFRARTGAVPVAFEAPIPETVVANVSLRGFVDRIDRTPDGRQAWIIDYKTGSARPYKDGASAADPFSGGTRLQLPVYVLAAQDAESVTALYWFITRRGEFEQIPYTPTAANGERFEATLTTLVDGLRAGAFPAAPGEEDDFYGGFTNCHYCDFDRICSRRRIYELREKLGDPAIEPWLHIGRVARGEEPA